MEVYEDVASIRRARWREPGLEWGLVPTMGALHAGHASLVERARAENARVAASIFVNPAQFNDTADLAAYPRGLERDLDRLRAAGVDLVWTPRRETVYPEGYQTYVEVERVTRPLEGAARAGHFRGVATVVAKLFNVFQPTRAYFGQKDAQQALTIRRMVADLSFDLEVVVCPTVREADGLALSSRNVNLDPEARAQSACLHRALQAARAAWEGGERRAAVLRDLMRATVEAAPRSAVDYVSVADPETLEELERIEDGALLSLAVSFGRVRLIDNVRLGEGRDRPEAFREARR